MEVLDFFKLAQDVWDFQRCCLDVFQLSGCTFSIALIRHCVNRVLSACVRENSVDALSGMHSSEYLFAKKTMLLHERGWPPNLCSLVHGRDCHMWKDRIGSLTSRMESYWSGLGWCSSGLGTWLVDSIRESLSGHLGNKSYLGETTIRASGHGQPSWLAMAGLNFVSGLGYTT